MVLDEEDGRRIRVVVPPELDEWLASIAERRETSREATVGALLTAVKSALATDDEPLAGHPSQLPPLERRLEELETGLGTHREKQATLETDLAAQHKAFHTALEDVRSRVVQLKRELDQDVPAEVESLEAVADDVAALEAQVAGGFENFESVLEHVLERLDDLEGRTTTVADAVLEIRTQQRKLATQADRRDAVDQLRARATELGTDTAVCEECATTLDVSLLTAPACHSCSCPFVDLEPARSFFGSPTLVKGSQPMNECDSLSADGADVIHDR